VVPGVLVMVAALLRRDAFEHLRQVAHQARLVFDGGERRRRADHENQRLSFDETVFGDDVGDLFGDVFDLGISMRRDAYATGHEIHGGSLSHPSPSRTSSEIASAGRVTIAPTRTNCESGIGTPTRCSVFIHKRPASEPMGSRRGPRSPPMSAARM